MVDESQLLMLPSELCRKVRMLGGTALTTKALLILEAARRPRDEAVSMPVGELAAAMGTEREHVARAVGRIDQLRCMVLSHDASEWLTFDVAPKGGATVGKGRGAVATLRTTADWRLSCDGDRVVPVPREEVREMTTRTGLLIRLRVAGLLCGREVPSAPRVRVRTVDLPDYTGYDGAGGPSTLLTQLVYPGLDDLNRHCSTVEVSTREAHRDCASKRAWFRHLDLRITPLKAESRSWKVLRARHEEDA